MHKLFFEGATLFSYQKFDMNWLHKKKEAAKADIFLLDCLSENLLSFRMPKKGAPKFFLSYKPNMPKILKKNGHTNSVIKK